MQSKVHPTYKTKYHVANWPAYNQVLVRRGDVTVWVSSEAIAAWTARRSGRRGGQRRYSDLAIETALTLRSSTISRCARPKGSCTRCSGSCVSTSPFPTIRRSLGAVSICGAVCGRSRPARALISCLTVRVCPSSGQGSGRPRHTVVAAGVAGGSSTVASISQV